jgi:hypothetical protein
LGQELSLFVELLKGQKIETVLMAADGHALPVPGAGLRDWMQLFRRAVTAGAL